MSAHEVTFRIGTSDGPIDCPVWVPDADGLIQIEDMCGTVRCSYTEDGRRCGAPAQQRAEWFARPDGRRLRAFACPAHVEATCHGRGWALP